MTYGTSASVSVASSLWGEADDSTLATSTVETVNLTGLTNDVTYNVGVVAVNAKGSSQLSKVIAVKPYNINMRAVVEGFSNPNANASNSDSENDKKDDGCNLFNSLRGKQINISF